MIPSSHFLHHVLLPAMLAALAPTGTARSANLPEALREAIRHGQARIEVDGDVAIQARARLNATGPLVLEVRKVRDLGQPGCARLQLDFRQLDALLPGASYPQPYGWVARMNICLDGQAPTPIRETMREKP